MALTTTQKTAIGLLLISILTTFSFIGYKEYYGKKFKFFHNNYIEFGVEDGIEQCIQCDREFYIRLNSRIPIPEDYKIKYNITDDYAYSVIIPNKEYREMWKVELFDNITGNKLDMPIQLWYKSGSRWYKYPPSTAKLSLSTQPKFFKVTANLSNDIAVSGSVGLKFRIFGQTIEAAQDPVWWINGNPIPFSLIQTCRQESELIDLFANVTNDRPIYGNCSKNENYIFINNLTGINETRTEIIPSQCEIGRENYIEYRKIDVMVISKDVCYDTGFNVKDKKIDYVKSGYKCSLNLNNLECDSVFDGNGDGKCDSGESCYKINLTDFSIQSRKDTKNLGDVQIE